MIIDGRALAQDIFNELKEKIDAAGVTPVLSVFMIGDNLVSNRYVALKSKKASEIGIMVYPKQFPEDSLEEDILKAIAEEVERKNSIIIQLPIPNHFDTEKIVNAVPASLDVDMLSDESKKLFEKNKADIYPPVVGSMREILRKENISLEGKKVVIVGQGELVGKPAAVWAKNRGAIVVVTDKDTKNLNDIIIDADVIICGAGVVGLIKPEFIKDGVVILDAGTSEDSGEIRGDADPNCAKKASLFTPVPGGIGPMTVAVLLKNVVKKAGLF